MALDQIDSTLEAVKSAQQRSQYDDLSDLGTELPKLLALCVATVDRLAPRGSAYRRIIEDANSLNRGLPHMLVPAAVGALEALRVDYEAGNLAGLPELIHAELFADFLEMADHLLDSGYKDAAAVIAGATLEGHLRQLAEANGVEVINDEGRPLKADRINGDLANANIYGKSDLKAVTAWLGLRNHAAHGEYKEFEAGQVGPMIAGIRDFIRRLPA
jgi:hypothetical protein